MSAPIDLFTKAHRFVDAMATSEPTRKGGDVVFNVPAGSIDYETMQIVAAAVWSMDPTTDSTHFVENMLPASHPHAVINKDGSSSQRYHPATMWFKPINGEAFEQFPSRALHAKLDAIQRDLFRGMQTGNDGEIRFTAPGNNSFQFGYVLRAAMPVNRRYDKNDPLPYAANDPLTLYYELPEGSFAISDNESVRGTVDHATCMKIIDQNHWNGSSLVADTVATLPCTHALVAQPFANELLTKIGWNDHSPGRTA